MGGKGTVTLIQSRHCHCQILLIQLKIHQNLWLPGPLGELRHSPVHQFAVGVAASWSGKGNCHLRLLHPLVSTTHLTLVLLNRPVLVILKVWRS